MENYIVSARKYRPATFDSVVGQKALTATLKNAVASGRLAHSYLFCGSRGVGKTSCARIFAKTINCEHLTPEGNACNECDSCRAFNAGTSMNIIELNAASNNGVDDMRSLVEQVHIPPSDGKYRVFIVDEVHMLSAAAFNAFLKTLEEPPSYVVFILATTEKHKIIPTILSRCQIYDFHRISIQDIIDHLEYVASQEGITTERAALNVIARKADGAMRDALSIFDQVAASSRGHITYQSAIDNLNVLDNAYYSRLLDAFLKGNVLDSWMIYKEIRDRGFDSHFLINGLAGYLRDLMVARDPATLSLLEAGDDVKRDMAAAAARCTPDFLYRALCLCNDADLNYRAASGKQLLVEITLAKICQLLSPSPSDGGAGEGRLKPIAGPAGNAPSAGSVPTQSAAASQPLQPSSPPVTATPSPPQPQAPRYTAPSPRAPSVVSEPVAPPIPPAKRKVISAPKISLRGQQAASPSVTVKPERQDRNEPFGLDEFYSGWEAFIAAHPKEHILVNTMRSSRPERVDATTYGMTVENDMQRQLMEQWRDGILRFLGDRLANDHIRLDVRVNEGQSSPLTWNEREVFNHMLEANPVLKKFVDGFNMSLG